VFYARRQKDAVAKLKEAQAAAMEGRYVDPKKITIAQWLNRWMETYKKNSIRQTTFDNYSIIIREHIVPTIGDIPLQKLRPDQLQQLYNEKIKEGLRRTVTLIHSIMHAALRKAYAIHLLATDITEAITPPAVEVQKRGALPEDAVKQFMEAAEKDRLYLAILLELTTGLRRGEVLGLRWEDVDLDNNLIHVQRTLVTVSNENGPTKTKLVYHPPKTKAGRRLIPLHPRVVDLLRKLQAEQAKAKEILSSEYQDNGLVFCTTKGTPISPRNYNRTFQRLRKKAGLEGVSPHVLRHTFATRLAEINIHPKVAQELLGHSKVATTLDIYTHANLGLKKQAISKLDGLLPTK
jgi:integrase